ncbi:Cell death abnormality protein 12 [Caenorhabditis elegans]|uniref:Cell death abnormality protein 12 n=2 Tax=Caenorhabditis elegans TaxID=6239 RepID=CED12_CAEEL|nr:Cell death abnormality protein 12 [Caenorhabditis elegans]Q8STE5.1 RecName: Full=Cell death abnormality protein 12 [Caenorhabditis elegans]AAL38510.1 PH domain protein CED-12 [Caenorhabditis elegans]AAL49495.1 CED-12 [Caenorhabditis elegans]CAD12890.1 Cell death abnormality protein 12 [Caenorhabditis elegans]|eukprot:NP_492693.1 Cell death abnormality protein 12 [Caenorhabditis elegans]
MAFHMPLKELQPVDTSLPEHVVKGAVVIDKEFTIWNHRAVIPSNALHTVFITINLLEQKLTDVVKMAARSMNLSEDDSYGLMADKPKRFITDDNLNSLGSGFILTLCASPDHYVKRITEILTEGNNISQMENAVKTLDEFSLDPALIEAFYRCSSLELLFSLIRDDRVCMSSTLLSTCLRALSSMLELAVGDFTWKSVPNDVVVSMASLVTGKAKREEANTLLAALQMLEQLVIGDDTTRDWILEEVPIETLIRHVEKSDERIALCALSLMNSMIRRCPDDEKRFELIKSLEVVPFRNAVHSSLLRGGGGVRNLNAIEQLVEVQRSLISAYETSPPTDAEVQKILDIESSEDVSEEIREMWKSQIGEHRCGRLAAISMVQFAEKSPQDLRMLISENTMRIEGGKWQLIPMWMRCCDIAAELFRVIPGRDELDRLIVVLFSTETPFPAVFACIVHLFHRTWREMQAKGGEMEKVACVVLEQLRHVLKRREIQDVEELSADLETFSYRAMQEIWREEQLGKENIQLHSEAVIQLKSKLRPKMEELVRINHLNYLKLGAVFRKPQKSKSLAKLAFWHWKLDASEKMLTITGCDGENYVEGVQRDDIRQVWIKDIADVTNNDEIDRKASSSRFTSSPSTQMLRGIRVQLKTTNDMKEGEVLMALTSDETQSVIWLEGLAELIGSKAVKSETDAMVERMLKMELRVRLLNVKLTNPEEKPEIPPIPDDIKSFISKF